MTCRVPSPGTGRTPQPRPACAGRSPRRRDEERGRRRLRGQRRPPLPARRRQRLARRAAAHRSLLLHPERKTLALGFARHTKSGDDWVTVLDLQRSGAAQKPDGAVLVPASRQTGVPLAFPGNEIPDPLPHTKDKLTGFPITATFPARLPVTRRGRPAGGRGRPGGDRLVLVAAAAGQQALARLQQNTLCLFATAPLAAGGAMSCALTGAGRRQGLVAHLELQHDPARRRPIRPLYRRAIARFNEVRKLAGLKPVRLDETTSKACRAHASYLARHLDRTPGPRLDDERPRPDRLHRRRAGSGEADRRCASAAARGRPTPSIG